MPKPRQSPADRRRIKQKFDEISPEKHGPEEYRRILRLIQTYGRPTPEEDILYPGSPPRPLLKHMKRYYRV